MYRWKLTSGEERYASLIYVRNNKGPNTLSSGTPLTTV